MSGIVAAVGCGASRVAESLPSPLRVVPIAIEGKICPFSRLCPWGFVLWVELWVELSGLVGHWLPIVVGVVYSVATVVVVWVVATVEAVAKMCSTVGMA